MRFWFSGPRILGGLVRPGASFNKSEPKLPDWRRAEIIKMMQDEGVVGADDKPITAREASLSIDKVIDTGAWTVQELMDGYKPPKKRFPWRKVFGTVAIVLVLLWSAFRWLMRVMDKGARAQNPYRNRNRNRWL
jgi:hypothetical protein